MDIEQMSNLDIDQNKVKSISDKCQELNDVKSDIQEVEKKLSRLKSNCRELEERIIPEMMTEAGVSNLK